jgi:hypothetical protein
MHGLPTLVRLIGVLVDSHQIPSHLHAQTLFLADVDQDVRAVLQRDKFDLLLPTRVLVAVCFQLART